MMIEKTSVVVPQTTLRCDLCDSTDIIETAEGYVCRECAVVLKIQKLQYNRPYNYDVLQHARKAHNTQIGNKRERQLSPHFRVLRRLNNYNKVTNNEKIVEMKAQREIARILSSLGLEDYESVKQKTLENFKNIRAQFAPGTKFRNVEKLVAIILYFRFKLDIISVPLSDILNITDLTKKEFNNFYLQIKAYFPNYAARNRQKYISQKLLEITNHFDLGMPFYFLSKKVLYRLWDGIKNTTDNVIAGLCASITALCEYKEEIKINSICELLDIRMSTIQQQVKNRLFDHYQVEGFTTLVHSSEMIKSIMVELNVIEFEEEVVIEREEGEERIELEFGNAQQVFALENENYLFGIVDPYAGSNILSVCYLEVHNTISYKPPLKREAPLLWFELMLRNYHLGKDPPGIG